MRRAEQERRIALLEDQIDRAAALSAEQKATILELQARNEELSAQLRALRDDVMKAYWQVVLSWAVKGSERNKEFESLIKSIKGLDRYPLELVISLEHVLRRRLRADEGVSLSNLISDAKTVGILDPEAADLAHTLRKQRNVAAHQVSPKGVRVARAMLCVFAASLLWRSFGPRSPS